MKIKIGVIFGGETVEHEVSIISALQAINNMDKDKYEIVPIYISKDRIWYTGEKLLEIDSYTNLENIKKIAEAVTLCKKEKEFYLINTNGIIRKNVNQIDIAFPIVHGNNVEDGTLQGYLDTVGIPYVGSKVIGAALGQDKVIMKQIFQNVNLPVVDYVWFYDYEYYENQDKIIKEIEKLKLPVVVKPANLGSSVGINYVSTKDSLEEAIEEALNYDTKIIVEKAVNNLVEVNCSVLGNYQIQETSAIEEVTSSNELLTYKDKYLGNGKTNKTPQKGGMANASRIIPARISEELTDKVKTLSKEVFKALNLSGVCRIDFLIDEKKQEVYINEPNTIPGSLAFYLWEPLGIPYKELLDKMISIAVKESKNQKHKTYAFDTNILSNYKNNGVKGNKVK